MASRERSPALRIGIISDTHGSLAPTRLHGAGRLRPYHPRRRHLRAGHSARVGNPGPRDSRARQQRLRRVRQRGRTFRASSFGRRALPRGPQAGRRARELRRLGGTRTRRPAARRHRARAYPRTRTRGRPRGAAREHLLCALAPCTAPAAISAAPSRRWTWKTAASCTPG